MTILNGCRLCYFVKTEHRNEGEVKQKEQTALVQDEQTALLQDEQTALLQDEQRKLTMNVDELKDQVERHSTTLRVHSQIVATQC